MDPVTSPTSDHSSAFRQAAEITVQVITLSLANDTKPPTKPVFVVMHVGRESYSTTPLDYVKISAAGIKEQVECKLRKLPEELVFKLKTKGVVGDTQVASGKLKTTDLCAEGQTPIRKWLDLIDQNNRIIGRLLHVTFISKWMDADPTGLHRSDSGSHTPHLIGFSLRRAKSADHGSGEGKGEGLFWRTVANFGLHQLRSAKSTPDMLPTTQLHALLRHSPSSSSYGTQYSANRADAATRSSETIGLDSSTTTANTQSYSPVTHSMNLASFPASEKPEVPFSSPSAPNLPLSSSKFPGSSHLETITDTESESELLGVNGKPTPERTGKSEKYDWVGFKAVRSFGNFGFVKERKKDPSMSPSLSRSLEHLHEALVMTLNSPTSTHEPQPSHQGTPLATPCSAPDLIQTANNNPNSDISSTDPQNSTKISANNTSAIASAEFDVKALQNASPQSQSSLSVSPAAERVDRRMGSPLSSPNLVRQSGGALSSSSTALGSRRNAPTGISQSPIGSPCRRGISKKPSSPLALFSGKRKTKGGLDAEFDLSADDTDDDNESVGAKTPKIKSPRTPLSGRSGRKYAGVVSDIPGTYTVSDLEIIPDRYLEREVVAEAVKGLQPHEAKQVIQQLYLASAIQHANESTAALLHSLTRYRSQMEADKRLCSHAQVLLDLVMTCPKVDADMRKRLARGVETELKNRCYPAVAQMPNSDVLAFIANETRRNDEIQLAAASLTATEVEVFAHRMRVMDSLSEAEEMEMWALNLAAAADKLKRDHDILRLVVTLMEQELKTLGVLEVAQDGGVVAAQDESDQSNEEKPFVFRKGVWKTKEDPFRAGGGANFPPRGHAPPLA